MLVTKLVTWPHPQYNLNDVVKFCWWRHGQKYDVITFISKYLYFKKARVANFADPIKIATMRIKITFKDSKKMLKELEIMH